MAKAVLNEPVDIDGLAARGPATAEEALRLELYDRLNALGIGAQGLGGLTAMLAVKVRSFPTHAASLPVAFIPNCAARHIHFTPVGAGPVDPVASEVIGPAGPTTARRMDKFTQPLPAVSGLKLMIGKAEGGPAAIEAIRENGAIYLVSPAVCSVKPVAYEDLGMAATYGIVVAVMPVIVAVDMRGQSIHALVPPCRVRKM